MCVRSEGATRASELPSFAKEGISLDLRILPMRSDIMAVSTEIQTNREAMLELVVELRSKLETVKKGGGEAAVRRHKERGKMFVRERIDAVIDSDTPLLEFTALAANGMYG